MHYSYYALGFEHSTGTLTFKKGNFTFQYLLLFCSKKV